MTKHGRSGRSGGGRPRRPPHTADEADARRRLLDAAARRFAEQGFAATSLRQVAEDAGVTPAMVSYYFRDKHGLLEAVLMEGIELLLAALAGALAGDAASPDAQMLPRFVESYLRALTAHPWIPRIIVQEVISRDTPLRSLFVERFARRALTLVAPMVSAEIEAGRLRRDLDVRLTVMSVVGMCVFPYIAEPLLGRLLDYRVDDAFADLFVPHTVSLLAHGLGEQR